MKICCIYDRSAVIQALNSLLGDNYAVDFRHIDQSPDDYLANLKQYSLLIIWLKTEVIGPVSVCLHTRHRNSRIPLLVVINSENLEHRVELIHAGADDCVVATISQSELQARIDALLRRFGGAFSIPEISHHHLVVDPNARTARYKNASISLRRKEFDILLCLLQHRGITVTSHKLIDTIWGEGRLPESNALTVHIYSLRQKIDRRFKIQLIVTVPGVGYRIEQAA